MRLNKFASATVHRTFVTALFCVLAAALLCGIFASSASAIQNVAYADNSLIPPTGSDKIQIVTYDKADDWVAGLTQSYQGNLESRVHYNPSESGYEVNYDSRLYAKKGISGVNKSARWCTLYQIDDYLMPYVLAGAFEVKISLTLNNNDTDDYLCLSGLQYDTPTKNFDEKKENNGAYVYDGSNKTRDFDSGWRTLSKKNLTFTFFHKSPSGAQFAEFKNIVVSFRINPEKMKTAAAISALVSPYGFRDVFTTEKATQYTPELGVDNAVLPANSNPVIPYAAGSIVADKYAHTHTASTLSAWTNVGQRLTFDMIVPTVNHKLDYNDGNSFYDSVSISYDGTAYTLAAARSAGLISADSKIDYKNVGSSAGLYDRAVYDIKFIKNGEYILTHILFKAYTFSWDITVGGIDTTAPELPSGITITPNGTNDWFNSTSFSFDVTLNNSGETDSGAVTSRTAPRRFFYKLSSSLTGFDDCAEITDAQMTDILSIKNNWFEGNTMTLSNVASGYHKMRVVAVDYAGNISGVSDTFTFKSDSTAPTFTPNIKAGGVAYLGDWTNRAITIDFVTAGNPSGADFLYRLFYSSDSSTTEWQAVSEDCLTIDYVNTVKDCQVQFKAVSGSGLEYVQVPPTQKGSNSNGYFIKYDSITPDKPQLIASGVSILDYLKPASLENAKWYTSSWVISSRFEIIDDYIGNGVKLYYSVADQDTENIHTSSLEFSAQQNNVSINYNVNELAKGGVKVLRYWTVDQAGNASEATEYQLIVDANKYDITTTVADNTLFPTVGGKINARTTGYFRGESVNVTIVPTRGYKFFKLFANGTDVSAEVNESTLMYSYNFSGSDFNQPPTTLQLVASFRRIVEITGQTTAVYSGAAQKPVLSASITSPDGFDFLSEECLSVLYNGENTYNNVVNVGEYNISFVYTGFNDTNENYFVIANPFSFSITAAPLTVEVVAGQSKVYGESDGEILYDARGLKGSDGFEGVLSRAAGEDVGSYQVELGSLAIKDDKASNYTITYIYKNFNITKRAVTIAPDTDVFEGEYKNDAYSFGFKFVEGSAAVIGVETLMPDVVYTTVGVTVGQYKLVAMSADGSDINVANPNYSITAESADFTIVKCVVDFAYVRMVKEYGSDEPELKLVPADNKITEIGESVDNVVKSVSGLAREQGDGIGLYSYIADGVEVLLDDNFEVGEILTPYQFEITQRAFYVSILSGQTLVYGSTIQLDYTLSNLLEGNQAQIVLNVTDRSAGLRDVIVESFEITDGENVLTDNYKAVVSAGAQVNILPYTIDVTLTNLIDKPYDATSAYALTDDMLVYTVPEINGVQEVMVFAGTAALADSAVGINKLVTADALSITDVEGLGRDSNYTLNLTGSYSVTVLPAEIAVALQNNGENAQFNKVYDGTVKADFSAFTVNVSGVVGSDDVTAFVSGANYNSAKVAEAASVSVKFGLKGAAASNYVLSADSVYTYGGTISRRETEVGFKQSVTYGDSLDLNLSYGNLAGGDTVQSLGLVSNVAAFTTVYTAGTAIGQYDIALSADDFTAVSEAVLNTGNYILKTGADGTKTLTVTARSVTLVASQIIFNEGAAPDMRAVIDFENVYGSDILDFEVVWADGSAPTAAGSYAVTINLLDNNYKLVNGQLTVYLGALRKVVIVFNSLNKVYDGTAFAVTADNVSVTFEDSGDAVEGWQNYAAFTYGTYSAAGEYSVGLTVFNQDGGYAGSANGTYTITPRPVTVKAVAAGKIYGESDTQLQYIVENLVDGDMISGSLARAGGEDVGTYAINAGTLDFGANYTLNFVSADFEIKARTAYIDFGTVQKIYDGQPFGAEAFSNYYLLNVLAGDSVTVSGSAAVEGVNADSYSIDISQMSTDNSNYVLAVKEGLSAVITRRTVYVNLNAPQKVYGSDDDLTYTYENAVSGDVLSGGISRAAGENAQVYALDFSALTFGEELEGNYNKVYNITEYTISKALLSLELAKVTAVYGDEIALDKDIVTVSGLIAGDEGLLNDVLDALTVEIVSTVKNAGIYSAGYAVNLNNENALLNYYVLPKTGEIEVLPAPLTITANDKTVEYGASVFTVDFTVDGLKYDDAKSIVSGQFAAATDGKPGTYPVAVAKAFSAGKNYSVSIQNEQAIYTITARKLVIKPELFTAYNKYYDGTAAAVVDYAADKVAGDSVKVEYTALFDNPNAGERNINLTKFALSGAQAAYYQLVTVSGDDYVPVESGSTLTLDGARILKYKWTLSDDFINVAAREYDGTSKVDKSAISVVLPEQFSASGIINSVSGTYSSAAAGTVGAAVELRLNIRNASTNIEFVNNSANIALVISTNAVVINFQDTDTTITKRALVLKDGIAAINKVFNNKTDAYLSFVFSNIVSGDEVLASYSADFVDTDGNKVVNAAENIKVLVNSFVITGRSADNYSFEMPDTSGLTADILKATFDAAISAEDKFYDTTDSVTIVTNGFSGLPNITGIDGTKFTYTFESARFDGKDVRLVGGEAAYKTVILSGLTLALAEGFTPEADQASLYNLDNYTIGGVNEGVYFTSATIKPVVIRVNDSSVALNNKVYDGTSVGTVADGVQFLGAEHLDNVTINAIFDVQWQQSAAGANLSAVISITALKVKINGTEIVNSPNFVLNSAYSTVKTGTISRAVVKITGVPVNDKYYDGTAVAPIGSVKFKLVYFNADGDEIQLTESGAYAGDSLQIVVNSAMFAGKDVLLDASGSVLAQSITLSNITLEGRDAKNYCFSVDGTETAVIETFTDFAVSARIKPLVLRYKVVIENKTYDSTTDVKSFRFELLTALPDGESPIISASARYASADANDYAKVIFEDIQILTDNSVDNNYTLFGFNGTIEESARIYKANIDVAIENAAVEYGAETRPTFGVSYRLSGTDLVYNSADGTLKDADGSLITGFVPIRPYTSATRESDAGTYPILYDSGAAKNYNFIVSSGVLRVTPAVLTSTVDAYERLVGRDNPTFKVNLTGFKLGQTSSTASITELPKAATSATRNSPAGDYGITISGGIAKNYTFDNSFVGVLKVVTGTVSGFVYSEYTSMDNGVYVKQVTYSGAPYSMSVQTRTGYSVKQTYYSDAALTKSINVSNIVDAGTYYVKTEVSKLASNNRDVDQSYSPQVLLGRIVVNKATAIIYASGKTADFTGTPIAINPADVRGNFSVVYNYIKADGTVLTQPPADVGVYTVRVVYDGSNPNYEAGFVEVTLTIQKVKVTITVTKNKFVADGSTHTVEFTSNAPEGVLSQPDFYGADTSLTGTYNYKISSLNSNYVVVNGEGSITVGRGTVSLENGTITPLNQTIIDQNMTFVVKNLLNGENGDANLNAEASAIWTLAQNMTESNSTVMAIVSAKMYITASTGKAVESPIDGQLRIVLNVPDGVKVKRNTKLYYLSDEGEYSEVDADFESGKVTFVTDEMGYFLFVDDATQRTETLYVLAAAVAAGIIVAAIIIVIKKINKLKLLKAALDKLARINR